MSCVLIWIFKAQFQRTNYELQFRDTFPFVDRFFFYYSFYNQILYVCILL